MGDVYNQVCSYDNIQWSFDFLRRRNKNAGPDGISWTDILKDKHNYIENLVYELRNQTYMPNPDIIKQKLYPNSEKMLHYVEMNIREKIVEYAIKRQIYPICDEVFVDFSCAYRQNFGQKQVTKLIKEYSTQGYKWYISLDIMSFFSSINQRLLLNNLQQVIKDSDIVRLIKKCLWLDDTIGLPSGHVLSPLLSNFYLYKVDKNLLYNNYKVIRYADNYCIATIKKEDLYEKKLNLEMLLKEYGMTFNELKTKYVFSPQKCEDIII